MYRLDAYKVYLIMGAAGSLFSHMIFTVLAVYYVQVVGMNPLQLVLVGTTLELTILLFEVPTGVLADAYSRRLSVIIGITLVGICYVIQGMVPFVTAIFLAEFVRGVGETFFSGAASAWIADEVGEDRVGHTYLRGSQVSRLGAFAGILLGAGLATYQLYLPVLLGGICQLGLSLFLLLTMPEHGFTPRVVEQRTSLGEMFSITREGMQVVRQKPVVFMFLLVGVVFGAFSEGFDRLWETHFLRTIGFPAWANLEPIVWIGLINAGAMALSIGASELLIRRLDLRSPVKLGRTLFVVTALLIVAVVGFGLAGSFAVALAAYWLAAVMRSVHYPIAGTWLNRHIHSRVRATVLSMINQFDAVGQVAGGPVVGVVGLRSLRLAMVFSGLILSPALYLYGRNLQVETDGAPEPTPDPNQNLEPLIDEHTTQPG